MIGARRQRPGGAPVEGRAGTERLSDGPAATWGLRPELVLRIGASGGTSSEVDRSARQRRTRRRPRDRCARGGRVCPRGVGERVVGAERRAQDAGSGRVTDPNGELVGPGRQAASSPGI